jgi:UDP-N-acetylmuramoyl-tripeptide--D-alanyl-D-alanine ligase
MDTLKISEVIKAVNGKLINSKDEVIIKGIATKIVYIRKGCLFIPLVGKRPVSKELIEIALQRGAVAAVIPNQVNSALPQVITGNTISAFISLYKYYRSKFSFPVIGITGSAGKTSTKDMLALVLGQKFKVCKTVGNSNQIPGVVNTVLRMGSNHGAAVLEMGFPGYYGCIKRLANIARPNIAVITNISTGHFQRLGSKDNIMKAKMEITKYFDKNSILIINGDDECLSKIKDKPYRIIKVSTKGNGDYNAINIVNNGESGVSFKCAFKGKRHLFKINVPGTHFIYSALICIAIGDLLGLDVDQIRTGIANFKPYALRMNVINLPNNIKIIYDCYNANLISMKSALDVLKTFNGGRKVAILGDILEQGKYSEEFHREVGKYAIDKCDILVSVGNNSKYIYEEAKNHVQCMHYRTRRGANLYLKNIIKPKDIILLKASRGMHLEKIGQYLIGINKEK